MAAIFDQIKAAATKKVVDKKLAAKKKVDDRAKVMKGRDTVKVHGKDVSRSEYRARKKARRTKAAASAPKTPITASRLSKPTPTRGATAPRGTGLTQRVKADAARSGPRAKGVGTVSGGVKSSPKVKPVRTPLKTSLF